MRLVEFTRGGVAIGLLCRSLLVAFVVLLVMPYAASADMFVYNGADTVFGRTETYETTHKESLIEIARNFSIGYNAIVAANPDLDPFVPGTGQAVVIPTQWVLPDVRTPRTGIIVNLSDFRLYYFFERWGNRWLATFPVGIGDDGKTTPVGYFSVVEKLVRPVWIPPPSVREEDPSLPRVVPSGPENPLGSHALRLSERTVLIHGTHRPFGVGRKVSHGCVRLYPEDIPILFRLVNVGTRVIIMRQPVKIGTGNGKVYIQVHDDPEFKGDYMNEVRALLKKKRAEGRVDMDKIESALEIRDGIPVDITKEQVHRADDRRLR